MGRTICPVCADGRLRRLHRGLAGGRGVDFCERCGMRVVHPFPTAAALAAVYDDHYFANPDGDGLGYESYAAFRPALEDTFRRNLKVLRRYRRGGRLLEVGCAEGYFLPLAASAGFVVEGLEIAAGAAARAAALGGCPVHAGTLESFPPERGPFDVIAAWDVIEHLADPVDALTRIRHLLRPDGLLIATVPDPDGWLARLMGRHWFGWQALPEHPVYFRRRALRALCERLGFRVRYQRPHPWTTPLSWLAAKVPAGPAVAGVLRSVGLADALVPFPFINQLFVAQRRTE